MNLKFQRPKATELLALLLSLAAVFAARYVAGAVLEDIPHIEDEIAYVWQAEAFSRGYLTVESPPDPEGFLVPFVVDYEGKRFGKYPPGWPLVLAAGVILNLRGWVNPVMAGIAVWLTFRIGRRTFGESVGVMAALLTLISPFFLMNAGSLLSHPLGLVLAGTFTLAWLGAFVEPLPPRPWLSAIIAALALGSLALTRPLTAVAVALPFGMHSVSILLRGAPEARKRLLVFTLVAALVASLYPVWQYAVTGDALLNPYTLWWEYDKVGFGPGVGRLEAGHTLRQAWINTRFSLRTGWYDLFGWGRYSWILLPLGALAWLKHIRDPQVRSAWLVGSLYPSLVGVYLAYWIGSWLLGPRYYYEGLYSLTILSAAGVALLAGWPTRPGERWRFYQGWRRLRPLLVTAVFSVLIFVTVYFYLPSRLSQLHGLYGISRTQLRPFQTPQAQDLTPALVIVHPGYWTEFGALLELSNPFLDTPFIFYISGGEEANEAVAKHFPERNVIHYYPDDPYTFFLTKQEP